MDSTAVPPAPSDEAPQRIVKVRRDYNSWVASETLEDYALRFTPQRFRRMAEWRVASTAFGGAASFLILEAVGATLLVQYGFVNAFWAILGTGLIIFLAGLPISVYAARYGVDMDLLTRGAGFGYIGSTLTSLIYASFTFIFFALEAAVMAYALELALGIPPVWGYLVCALVVIPLVTHGISAISRLQVWTQPIWLLMLVVPFVYVLARDPGAFSGIAHYVGVRSSSVGFDLHLFGAALTVGIALITQMGEQADYLRFMPARSAANRGRWWAGVLVGGPGWVVLGVLKMLGGALLAYLAISHMVPPERAIDPNQMYLAAYEYVFPNYGWAVLATAIFVVISQLKINVTNAYAGSLAWSNFFSRVTHSHPGRVVWVVFNALIAFMLMEMNVFEALGDVLGLYANIAIAWMMAVVADLVINKPLGLSPPGIEFKRAHLWDINPVGVGAMALASVLSITAHLGVFGPLAQAFSALIALGTAFVASPVIAWATRGKYYIARISDEGGAAPFVPSARRSAVRWARVESDAGSYRRLSVQRCVICEREYEGPDMAHCPAYQGPICSLCCTLDARCGDLCKPQASLSAQWSGALRWLLPRRVWPYLDTGLGHFLLLMLIVVPLLAAVFGVLYQQELRALSEGAMTGPMLDMELASLRSGFLKAYMALMLIAGIVSWWLVLAQQSRKVAQEESNRQTHLLVREIELHRETDRALQAAKQTADQANQAKSRYISAISHELRTPLNSILGYAQLMGEDAAVPPHRRQAVAVIRRGGEHLLSLIEGTLDIAHIEAGKLTLHAKPMQFAEVMSELADMFELQAVEKGLAFRFETTGAMPELVRADEKRVRQILINLLGNAIKFTTTGQVTLRLRYAREFAAIEIEDTGPGMSAEELGRIFEPFARGSTAGSAAPGAGLGLTIAKMLIDLMGGEMTVQSTPGVGSVFRLRLFLPHVHAMPRGQHVRRVPAPRARRGYEGRRRRLMVVDNEEADRELLVQVLAPLGFELRTAASGHDALDLIAAGWRPDAMFIDLAMPGIDGWETIRRARALGLARAAVAIVSANAFDKRLDNDAGITPEDFFVKPVRHSELLDWLERRLELRWTDNAVAAVPPSQPVAAAAMPSPDSLRALEEAVSLGYFRGIMNQLDVIDAAQPECAAWTAAQRALARQFQFDRMCFLPAGEQFMSTSARDFAGNSDLVLIVDDVPDNLAVLHDALDESGYTVLVATNGEQALQRAAQARPDIVLLDAMMPGIDGFEVARRLKADAATAHIPIVFMTGLTETEHLVAALEAGGVDYVTKPIKPKEVLARMNVHLQGARRARQEAQQAGQARNALDAFGYASITVRMPDGKLIWQTVLARDLLLRYCGTSAPMTPPVVLEWLQRHLPDASQRQIEPPVLSIEQGPTRLDLRLHQQTGHDDDGDDWLIIMREVSDTSVIEAMSLSLKLTTREAEVLYWVVKGKTNKDIGEILGSSPATAKKHLERVYVKLGVETRTAAAGVAMKRIRELQPQFEL